MRRSCFCSIAWMNQKRSSLETFFKLYALEVIDKALFPRQANMLEKAYIHDIIALYKTKNNRIAGDGPEWHEWYRKFSEKATEHGLYSLGLLEQKLEDKNRDVSRYASVMRKMLIPADYTAKYTVSRMGYKFLHMMYFRDEDLPFLKEEVNRY